MPPEGPSDHQPSQQSEDGVEISLTPLLEILSESSTDNSLLSSISSSSSPEKVTLPLEHNLKELLEKVSGTENLETVTQIKLRVISRETMLQHLNLYLPGLRELTLDGSAISSLRDLGVGLKGLKILRVNRCGLLEIDGVLGLEALEELYACDNAIKDITPCAFLLEIRILDFSRNNLRNIEDLQFLSLCPRLVKINVFDNDVVDRIIDFRSAIIRALPQVRVLNGRLVNDSAANNIIEEEPQFPPPASRRFLQTPDPAGYVISFAPKICFHNTEDDNVN